jgi:hypothetical protein
VFIVFNYWKLYLVLLLEALPCFIIGSSTLFYYWKLYLVLLLEALPCFIIGSSTLFYYWKLYLVCILHRTILSHCHLLLHTPPLTGSPGVILCAVTPLGVILCDVTPLGSYSVM